jgi:hypothetical protein
MVSNCKIWANIQLRRYGKDLVRVSRPTTRVYGWWIKFDHVGVMPHKCPEKGIPCPYIRAYVPTVETLGYWPLPLFKGKLQEGDF